MPQISSTITETLFAEIKKISEKDKRTLSSTVEILLERCIKERNRKVKDKSQTVNE